MTLRLFITCILLVLPVVSAQAASNDCLATASAPAYEEGKSAPCSVTLDGKIRTDAAFTGEITGADGAITDGASAAIKATVKDYTNSNPLTTIIVDTNGDPASIGGGTQYPQGGAATDTDTMTMAGCVRADTAAAATGVINGDRARCIVDATGRMWVHVGTIDGGTITTITNPVTITDGSGSLNVIVDSGTITAVTSITNPVTVTDGAGALNVICDSGCGSGTQYAEDAAHSSGDQVSMAGAVRRDTAASSSGTDGDISTLNVDASGRLWVNGSGVTQPVSGTVTVTDGAGALNVICDSGCSGGTQYAEDTVHSSGDTVTMAGVVRSDATAALAADGDRSVLQVDSNGHLKVVNTNPNLAADNSANATAKTPVLAGTANASAPSWTEGRQVPLSTDLSGALRVTGSAGTTQYNQGTAGTATDSLAMTGAVRKDTAAVDAGVADGDRTVFSTDSVGRLRVTSADTTQPVSGTVSITANSAVNVAQINGVTPLMGAGNTGTGSHRVTEATDSQLSAGVGATGDAAATAGSTGSITAKLRLMTSQLDTISTNVASLLTSSQLVDDDQTGASMHHRVSAGSTEDEHEIKGSAGRLFSITATNTNAAARYLRCANQVIGSTTPGTTTVFLGLAIPGATTGAGFTTNFGPTGIAFSTGLTCWLVTGAAETDVAEVAANEINVNYTFK